MTTIRLRNARERLSHVVLAVADSTASPEDLIEAEHQFARALDWPPRGTQPQGLAEPSTTALEEARTQAEAAIDQLPDAARSRVRDRLARTWSTPRDE